MLNGSCVTVDLTLRKSISFIILTLNPVIAVKWRERGGPYMGASTFMLVQCDTLPAEHQLSFVGTVGSLSIRER